MLRDQLPKNLKLPNLEDRFGHFIIERTYLLSEDLISLLEGGVEVSNVDRKVIVKFLEVPVKVFVEDFL